MVQGVVGDSLEWMMHKNGDGEIASKICDSRHSPLAPYKIKHE